MQRVYDGESLSICGFYTMTWLWRFDDSMKTTLQHHEKSKYGASFPPQELSQGGCFVFWRNSSAKHEWKDRRSLPEPDDKAVQGRPQERRKRKRKGIGRSRGCFLFDSLDISLQTNDLYEGVSISGTTEEGGTTDSGISLSLMSSRSWRRTDSHHVGSFGLFDGSLF